MSQARSEVPYNFENIQRVTTCCTYLLGTRSGEVLEHCRRCAGDDRGTRFWRTILHGRYDAEGQVAARKLPQPGHRGGRRCGTQDYTLLCRGRSQHDRLGNRRGGRLRSVAGHQGVARCGAQLPQIEIHLPASLRKNLLDRRNVLTKLHCK